MDIIKLPEFSEPGLLTTVHNQYHDFTALKFKKEKNNIVSVAICSSLSRTLTHTHTQSAVISWRYSYTHSPLPPGHGGLLVLSWRTAGSTRSSFRQQFRVAVVTR